MQSPAAQLFRTTSYDKLYPTWYKFCVLRTEKFRNIGVLGHMSTCALKNGEALKLAKPEVETG
jgi:hypothetical protein